MATLALGLSKRTLLLSLCLLSSAALAEEMPRFSGNGSVTQSVNGDVGAILDIGGGITMTLPKGIPVGRSRLVTFKKAAKAPTGAQVKKGFTPIGSALEFNMPVSSGDSPILVSTAAKSDPAAKGGRLVIAMEVGTFCNDANKATKGKDGLCSGWELYDAKYDSTAQLITAQLQSTGGKRLLFGVATE